MPVQSQADRGVPENVRYKRAGLSFATLHVVGSNNDRQPWTGIGATTATPEQVEEEHDRMAPAIANLQAAFREARRDQLRGVVLDAAGRHVRPTCRTRRPRPTGRSGRW